MKRLFSLFLCCVLLACLLSSCQPRLSSDEDMLNYPGLTWGMSLQEVMDALHLTEDQVQKTEDSYTVRISYSPGKELFGLTPKSVVFEFSIAHGQENLSDVFLIYPGQGEETIETLTTGIGNQYGPLKQGPIFQGDTPPASQSDGSSPENYWASPATLQDILTPQEAAAAQELLKERMPDYPWGESDYWQVYLQTMPVASITLRTGDRTTYRSADPEDTSEIHLDASSYITFLQVLDPSSTGE